MKKRKNKFSYAKLLRDDPEAAYYYKSVANNPDGKDTTFYTFTRLNNRKRFIKSDDFVKAGYPMAICPNKPDWTLVHKWCGETFQDGKGRRLYSWTGSKFWFTTEADRDKFVKHFYSGNDVKEMPRFK